MQSRNHLEITGLTYVSPYFLFRREVCYLATILIFVRHGESEGNMSGRFNGSLDFPLTERGKIQAVKTAEYLDKYKIDKVYASDLLRAKETAEIIAKRQNLKITERKALREINGGDFEGVVYEELYERFPVEFKIWRNDLGNCKCPNGESIRELLNRFNTEVLEIAKNNNDKTVLIGTHAMPIRAMKTVWDQKDITEIKDIAFVKNAAVTVVDYTDIENPKVLEYDVADHLGELITEIPKHV